MYLRVAAIALSLLIHASIGYAMLPHLQDTDMQAMDVGKGMDVMLVQSGDPSDSAASGGATETPDIPEVTAMQATPPPPPEEKKPDELRDIVASQESPVEQQVVKTDEPPPPPDTPPPPPETAQMVNQPEMVAQVKEVQGAGKASGGDAKAYGRYMSKINDRVQKAKQYARGGATGTVIVRYTIGVDGRLLSKEVATSSGYKILDDAATAALDRAAPFPPIPPEVSVNPLAFTQSFRFVLR